MNPSLNKYDNLALEASAGTGKTFQLAMRVTGMLLTGIAPKDILCLTFTKKATAEMKERIIKFINNFAEKSADTSEYEYIAPLMQEYAKKLGEEYNYDFIKEKAIVARDNLFSHFSELNIKTIDAFNNTILKIFPFEAGFRPDFDIESDNDIEQIKTYAFDSIISNILHNEKWKKILDNIYKILGKQNTSFISTLQNYAENVVNNVLKLANQINNTPTIDDILNKTYKAIDIEKEVIILCKEFKSTFDDEVLKARQQQAVEKLEQQKIKNISELSFFKNQLDEVANFKNYDFTSLQYDLHGKVCEKLQEYWLLYGEIIIAISLNLGLALHEKMEVYKKEQNILTYNDISNAVYYMLAGDNCSIDKDYLYFRLDGKINHLLMDEFQDTSISQWLTLKPLAEEAMAGIGQNDKAGSFFYVGDPKQNIYRFRGGSSSLFRLLLKEYKDKLTSKTLNINYRSGKHIVDIVNRISNKIYDMYEDDFAIFNIDQKASSENNTSDNNFGYVEITHNISGKDANEDKYYLTYSLNNIKKCIDNGWQYKDIAILITANSHGKELINYLENNNIPVQSETSANLTSSPVFNIIISLAEFIETDNDYSFLSYLFTSPRVVDNKILQDKSLFFKEKNRVKSIISNMEGFTIFDKILYLSNKLDLQTRFNNSPDYYSILDIISQCAASETNIADFKETVCKMAQGVQSISALEKNAVTVMTIHKSKGLQFPVVILPNLSRDIKLNAKKSSLFIADNENFGDSKLCYIYPQDILPYIKEPKIKEYIKKEDKLILQDNINMLYVAMTRAEKALFINKEVAKNKIDSLSKFLGYILPDDVILGSLNAEKKQEKETVKSVDINVNINRAKELVNKKAFYKDDDNIIHDVISATIGSCLHAGLFILEYGNEESIILAEKCMYSKFGHLLDNEKMELVRKYIKQVYNNERWQALFKGRVFKERVIGEDNSLYIVDIYSEMEDKIIIMDYKTGIINETILESYKKQILRYAEILKKMYNKKTECYIFSMEQGDIPV